MGEELKGAIVAKKTDVYVRVYRVVGALAMDKSKFEQSALELDESLRNIPGIYMTVISNTKIIVFYVQAAFADTSALDKLVIEQVEGTALGKLADHAVLSRRAYDDSWPLTPAQKKMHLDEAYRVGLAFLEKARGAVPNTSSNHETSDGLAALACLFEWAGLTNR